MVLAVSWMRGYRDNDPWRAARECWRVTPKVILDTDNWLITSPMRNEKASCSPAPNLGSGEPESSSPAPSSPAPNSGLGGPERSAGTAGAADEDVTSEIDWDAVCQRQPGAQFRQG